MSVARARAGYLLVETQTGTTSERFLGDAAALARAGHEVWTFLVADAIAAAVRGANPTVAELIRLGGHVWVDDFTLRQRALTKVRLEPGITPVGMAQVTARLLTPDTLVVWH